MIDPPWWSEKQFEADRLRAIKLFRKERLEEPVETYSSAFDDYESVIRHLLKTTADLSDLDDEALVNILTDKAYLEAFRYLSGPPISQDDLKILAEAVSLAPGRLQSDPRAVRRIARIVLACLDRRRFPWVSEEREPTKAEKNAAILASATLMAYQRIQTSRRTEGKAEQERRVSGTLVGAGFKEVSTRDAKVLGDAPGMGEFCGESIFGTRKADFIVGLWDKRTLPIECKVSNSELNSVKRLNNDAAAKAEAWLSDFGPRNVVPVAVLSGVYKLSSLVEAQDRRLSLFWAHDLDAFVKWIERIRRSSRAGKAKKGRRR